MEKLRGQEKLGFEEIFAVTWKAQGFLGNMVFSGNLY